jgi:hemerythrin superfamily protein
MAPTDLEVPEMSMSQRDIITELLHDHEQVKQLFSRLERATASQTSDLFCELTTELVRHEVAEEEVIYPEARLRIPNGKRLCSARIREQAEAEKLLDRMEKAGPERKHFAERLARLRKAVLKHAENEERLIFEPFSQALDMRERTRLGDLYNQAKAAAPTHPHPHVPNTPPGNIMMGPVAALVDRARDAMHKVAS